MAVPSKSYPSDQIQSTHQRQREACLEQAYQQIGNQREKMMAAVNMPLLDPSSSLDIEMILCLALVTTFQYAEGLPDSVAADATVHRGDWRIALDLSENQPGIIPVSLCQFRELLTHSFVALQEYAHLLDYLEGTGYFDCVSNKPLDPGNLITTVCSITRYYHLKQAMKSALGKLVTAHPNFLRSHSLPHWYQRYHTSQLTLPGVSIFDNIPEEAIRLGKDIQHLLNTLEDQGLDEVKQQPDFQILDRLFKNNFMTTTCQMTWREPVCGICPNSTIGAVRSQSPPFSKPKRSSGISE